MLDGLIRNARYAVAGGGRHNHGDEFAIDTNRARRAGVNGSLSLRATIPELIDADDRPTGTPQAEPSGHQTTLDAALLERSLALRAGAHLIQLDLGDMIASGPMPLVREEAGAFVTIEPGIFSAPAPVDGEVEAPVSSLPVHTAAIDRDTTTQYAFRVEVPRSEWKSKSNELLSAEVMTAVVLGIARAADAELLKAINATTPSAFSISSAATAGVRFHELRGLIGTNGAGASIGGDGALRAGTPGPHAEITADMAETLVGAFDRAAIAATDIDLLVERTNAAGRLVVTAWLDLQALVPEPSKFWAVA